MFNILDLRTYTSGSAADPSSICKFVIVKYFDTTWLVFGPLHSFPYHANLLDEFCRRHDVPCAWIKRPDMLDVLDDDLKGHGGGYLQIEESAKSLRVWGQSTAYGPFELKELRRIVRSVSSMAGFKLTRSHD